MNVRSEEVPVYQVPEGDSKPDYSPHYLTPAYKRKREEDEIIMKALAILENRVREPGETIDSPQATRRFLILKLAEKERESFCMLLLDNRHRVIHFAELFHGTIDGAAVYPREVVKTALHHNAAAVILTHNHPSGVPDPSEADKRLTERLKQALALVDVRVLDHIVVGGTETVSFAENGLL